MAEQGSKYILPAELGPRQEIASPFMGNEFRELIEKAERRKSALHDERYSYFDHWRQISSFISPRRGKWLSKSSTKQDEGGRKHGKIINNMCGKASKVASAGLHSGLTPRSRPWFRATVSDPRVRRNPENRRWLHIVETILYEIFERSNWYSAMRTNYGEVGDFGTGVVSIHDNFSNVIHCRQHTIGSYYLGSNHLGVNDTFCEEFTSRSSREAAATPAAPRPTPAAAARMPDADSSLGTWAATVSDAVDARSVISAVGMKAGL